MSSKLAGPRAQDAELERLLGNYSGCCFDCGKWRGDDVEEYKQLYDQASKAKRQLIDYVSNRDNTNE